MKKLRYLAFLFFLIIIVISAFSCSNKKTNSEIESIFQEMTVEPDEETDEDEEGENNEETEKPAFADHLYVVIPKDCSAELSLRAREFSERLSDKTGIASTLKYDNELTSAPGGSCEILIGHTDRLASKNAIDVLRTDDYICRWDNGAIVICGRSDSSIFKAIDKFLSDVLPGASKYSLMSPDAHFENITEYDISSITLNGYDLYDYVISYSEDDGELVFEQADILRSVINRKSGYLLELIEEKELTDEHGKRLILSIDEGAAEIQTVGSDVVISAGDAYSLSFCVADFLKSIVSPDDKKIVELKCFDLKEIPIEDNSFGITYYIVKNSDKNALFASADLISAIKSSDRAVFLAFNVDPQVYARLTENNNFPSGYEIQSVAFGSEPAYIVYKSDLVKSLSYTVSGEGRILTVNLTAASGDSFAFSYILNATESDVASIKALSGVNAAFFAGYGGELAEEELGFYLKGIADLDSGAVDYIFAANEMAEISKEQSAAQNNTYKFCLSAKVRLRMSRELLDYALE